jgi:hypothetical protein
LRSDITTAAVIFLGIAVAFGSHRIAAMFGGSSSNAGYVIHEDAKERGVKSIHFGSVAECEWGYIDEDVAKRLEIPRSEPLNCELRTGKTVDDFARQAWAEAWRREKALEDAQEAQHGR